VTPDLKRVSFLIFFTSNIISYYHGSTALCLSLAAFFGFLILYTVGTTPWKGTSPSQGRYTQYKHTQNKRTRTSMSRVGFETTTLVFERAKTFHGVDREATVIGTSSIRVIK
jgi:hypothetical protein